jgi:hypothetical protein
VLSYGLAAAVRQDPQIIGQTLRLNGTPFCVIGVTAKGFQGTGIRAADIWLPLHVKHESLGRMAVAGRRVSSGVSLPQAAAEWKVIACLQQEYPVENREKELRVCRFVTSAR